MEENKQVVAEWKATNQERLTEIKSFNPELYSAINLALNYLNKSLTGEELPQEVEEVKVQPTQQEGFWRIMTEKELMDKYGSIEKAVYDSRWNEKGQMDWMFGMPIKDLIKHDLTEEQIEYELKSNVIQTDPSKDKNNKSWVIFLGFTVFDTSNVAQTVQPKHFGLRIVTKEEFKKKKLPNLRIKENILEEIYSKPIEDFYDTKQEIINAVDKIILDENPPKFTKGIAEGYSVTAAYFIYEESAEQPKESKIPAYRIVTKDEFDQRNLIFGALSPDKWAKIYGKDLSDFYSTREELSDAINRLEFGNSPNKFTRGIAKGIMLPSNYFTYVGSEPQTTSTVEWRFKTLDEIQKEGLGFNGTSEKSISQYTGKKLKDLVDSVALDIYIKTIKNQEGSIITSDGYSYPYNFFTDQPLPKEFTSEFKLSIETIPATLKRDYRFTANTGNRKSPSQSAGVLYSRYAGLPAAQLELLNTFFKGNDGQWWNLQQVKGTWRWEKSSPQPSQTATSGKNIDQMIKEASEKYTYNRSISNLPPYLRQLAINNQINERGVVNENNTVNTGFSWSKTKEGREFWTDVASGGFLSQKVLDVIGSKEKLFETPTKESTQQPKTETKQEWTPQDLVGKILEFSSSGKKYRVEKFIRNNPKNKEYKLRDLTSPTTPEITYKTSMSMIKTWLDGNVFFGARIIEETPTGSDYSTWTQIQLNQKRKEISDAMIVFEEDDPEYKELKDQLDVIDTFID